MAEVELTNRNFIAPNNFRFLIRKTPYTNFFIQKVNIPGVLNPKVESHNPFVVIPQTGDHLQYEPLTITFKVDEDLKNYIELYNWIRGTGFPVEHAEYKELKDQLPGSGLGLTADVSVLVLNNHKNVNYDVTYYDAFPYTLSDIQFDTTNQELDYLTAQVKFAYTYYDITQI